MSTKTTAKPDWQTHCIESLGKNFTGLMRHSNFPGSTSYDIKKISDL